MDWALFQLTQNSTSRQGHHGRRNQNAVEMSTNLLMGTCLALVVRHLMVPGCHSPSFSGSRHQFGKRRQTWCVGIAENEILQIDCLGSERQNFRVENGSDACADDSTTGQCITHSALVAA